MGEISKSTIWFPERPPVEPDKGVLEGLSERADAEIGLWFTHDPAIYKDDKTENYYIYCTGAMSQKSKDLVHWERIGKVVPAPPQESIDWVGGDDIWAPDIVKEGDEYRLYCSNSSWGVRQSCIFLAVSDNPEGPFIPRGCVLKTTDEMPVNAIDANIITDNRTGEQYMLYGSFWGGCHMLKLDRNTGLAAEDGIGVCVARRPKWQSGAIEGPYMVYNEEFGYYYLFVSYGSLKSDYNIRVGRSRNITGPFVDFNGRELTDIDDQDNTVGNLIFAGYAWNEGTAYMGPGHNSVLNDNGEWYVVCHIREKNFTKSPEPSTMQIRKLFWSEDGWPYTCAQVYCGERQQELLESVLIGEYEKIQFVPALPQGISTAVPMKLGENGYYECCSIQGKWYFDGKDRITIEYGNNKEQCIVTATWSHETGERTIAISGINDKGNVIWCKKQGEFI